MTKTGLGRINRSIEAFIYCIVGAQVNTRSSISGNNGGSQEVQQEFLNLFESALIEEDIAQSIQRYQLVIQEAKLRLNFAISPGIWLMPENLIINTESVVGYNNNLKKVDGSSMVFDVNDVNQDTKQVGIAHNLGKSKINLPHKIDKKKEIIQNQKTEEIPAPQIQKEIQIKKEISSHDLNKIILIISVTVLGLFLFR